MYSKKLDIAEEHLEDEMQKLFNETAVELKSARLLQLGRAAAQVPKEPKKWSSPWIRHVSGLACMVMVIVLLGDSRSFNANITHSVDVLEKPPQVDLISDLLGVSDDTDWESEIPSVGFELFHGSDSLDAAVLEVSLEALLKEKKQ